LGEGGDSAPEIFGSLSGFSGAHLDWDESALVEVDGQTSGRSEIVQNPF
jgi:hypothetical protein